MSQHNIHDLEIRFDSFIANIGANADGEETAYLYRSEGKRYIGCVTHEDEHYQWQPDFPAQEYTENFIKDLREVMRWMHLRQVILKKPFDEHFIPLPNTEVTRCIDQKTSNPSADARRDASRSVCEEFIELFQTSDMRPEDECHDLYARAKKAVEPTIDEPRDHVLKRACSAEASLMSRHYRNEAGNTTRSEEGGAE